MQNPSKQANKHCVHQSKALTLITIIRQAVHDISKANMLSAISTANVCIAHLYVPIMLNTSAMLVKQAEAVIYAFPLAQDSSGHQCHLG